MLSTIAAPRSDFVLRESQRNSEARNSSLDVEIPRKLFIAPLHLSAPYTGCFILLIFHFSLLELYFPSSYSRDRWCRCFAIGMHGFVAARSCGLKSKGAFNVSVHVISCGILQFFNLPFAIVMQVDVKQTLKDSYSSRFYKFLVLRTCRA